MKEYLAVAVNRSSTSLVRYLGTTVKANVAGGKLTNVISDGDGTQRRVDPSVRRQTTPGLVQDAIKISDYQAALGYLGQMGVDPLVAKTMAAVFVDVAKSQGRSVISLFETANDNDVALVNKEVLNRLNQLRDLSSQLSSSTPIDNTASVPARRIGA